MYGLKPVPFNDPNAIALPSSHLRIEFSCIWAYAKDADEFVRLKRRDRTGWRRDEWA
jgi:hypothetical protein